ncbi:MAG: phosphoribosylformylglycinamidine synthase, partial [Nonlabens sp.]
MIHFYGNPSQYLYAVHTKKPISHEDDLKLQWLFAGAPKLETNALSGFFTGPRATTITPWSTNAVEITQNMEIKGILRIEEFHSCELDTDFDTMLLQKFDGLDQSQFDVHVKPEEVLEIDDIAAYNMQEGLSLNDNEIDYLIALSEKLDRKLTDSEVFGFSQVNSEHCRHKIFNGTFIIDGEEM